MFETKEQRGRFLLILGAIAFVLTTALSTWSSISVNRKTDERVAEIRTALEGRTPKDLWPQLFSRIYGGRGETLPGGPYDLIRPSESDIRASVRVRSGVEKRCIRVHLATGGELTIETSKRGC